MCPTCGLEEDRDVIAVKNLLHKHQTDVGGFIRSPQKPSHDRRREGMKVYTRPERALYECRNCGFRTKKSSSTPP